MGLLDEAMRNIASTVVGLFTDTPAVFTRVATVYDEDEDTEVTTTTTASVKVAPPYPFEKRQVDGETVLETDLQTYVAVLDLETESFDPEPTTNVNVFMTLGGIRYSILAANPIKSGDEKALYHLHLRG